MNENPLISVIVPIYKVETYLTQCVDSILNQTYRNLEVILVDDGSPDGCPALCDAYAAKDSRVRVIHKENGGISSSRNTGLAAVTGDLIAFVDGDDYVEPNLYERLWGHMAADPRLDVVYSACTRYPFQDQLLHMDFFPTGTVVTGEEMARRMVADIITSHMWLGLYKRFCWEDIVFPEGRSYEDVTMTYRVFLKARYVGFVMEPLYIYRVNDTSITKTVQPRKLRDLYLAYRDRFESALTLFPDLADWNCTRAAQFGISLYFHCYAENVPELAGDIPGIQRFLAENRGRIRGSWSQLPRSRRAALRLYYISPGLVRLGARLFHVLGFQRRLGYQMK